MGRRGPPSCRGCARCRAPTHFCRGLPRPTWASPPGHMPQTSIGVLVEKSSLKKNLVHFVVTQIHVNLILHDLLKNLKRIFPLARPARALGEGRRWGGPQSGGPSWWSWHIHKTDNLFHEGESSPTWEGHSNRVSTCSMIPQRWLRPLALMKCRTLQILRGQGGGLGLWATT